MSPCCIDDSRITTSANTLSLDSGRCQINTSLRKFFNSCGPSSSNPVSCKPINWVCKKIIPGDCEDDELWLTIRDEALSDIKQEPILTRYYLSSILLHKSLDTALANHLALKLSNSNLPIQTLSEVFSIVFAEDHEIRGAIRDDLKAAKERDPACISHVHCLLNFKGFLACQAHRVAHKLWSQGRTAMALVIQNRVSEVFTVDIHPGAKIGSGILIDHATGVVIGETAVVGDNVCILHNVTLGGTGKGSGDRHPKIGNGVLIGAGANVLGNIRIGDGARIGAGSVVLKEVPPMVTVVGNPARLVGRKMDQLHKQLDSE